VEVLQSVFAYDGRQSGSLSEIAEAITGAHWNRAQVFWAS
jgi:hypothetical protein